MYKELEEILEFFPQELKYKLDFEIKKFFKPVQEIRLRKNKPVCIFSSGNNFILNTTVDSESFDYIFNRLCKYSVYSYQQDINNGFITTDFGCRVGVCGTAVLNFDKLISIKNISSLNFRIAKDFEGSAKQIISDNLENIIVAGVPASGKTT
ncbi:MAG: stage III sporulation protein AA, partial [Clostridia bacterium]|nr:stage III sporulation protein AA [Clostridia bacterium]